MVESSKVGGANAQRNMKRNKRTPTNQPRRNRRSQVPRNGPLHTPLEKVSIRQIANTNSGRRWVLKALHPCGETETSATRIPDGSYTSSCIMERRDEFVLNCPEKDLNWTCAVYSLPFLYSSTLAIAWDSSSTPSDADLTTNVTDAILHSGSNINRVYDYKWVKWPSDKKLWYQWLPCQVFDHNLANEDKLIIKNQVQSLRRTAGGLTIEYDANTLTDSGRLVSAQYPSPLAQRNITVADGDKQSLLAWVMPAMLFGADALVQADPKSRQCEAREGDYTPFRHWEPVFNSATGADNLRVGLASAINATDYIPDKVGTGNNNVPLFGWGVACTLWMGMDATTKLRLKRRECLEFRTGPKSPYGPFVEQADSYDSRALAVYREYARLQPHSFPSSYNSSGKLLPAIIRILGGVLSNLGLPIISSVANPAANTIAGWFE